MISSEISVKVRAGRDARREVKRGTDYCCDASVWTDHANFISLAYSGTGALKTDFTRTGKRTRKGLFEDGYNSVMRYLKNNFLDGARQVRKQFTPSG